jgi:hypothetical protein
MSACPLCGGAKAKRQCPALDRLICPTCCGTKRQLEIRCPADCGWLKASRAHPHAAQQRQQEQDSALIVQLISGLDDEAYTVLMACLPAAVAFRSSADPPPLDEELGAAAAALAATAETAARGVLYEHQPESMVAARLARAMSAPLAEASEAGLPRLDTATVVAMRRLADSVKAFRRTRPESGTAYFAFLERVLKPQLADANTGQGIGAGSDPLLSPLAGADLADTDGPRIIIP